MINENLFSRQTEVTSSRHRIHLSTASGPKGWLFRGTLSKRIFPTRGLYTCAHRRVNVRVKVTPSDAYAAGFKRLYRRSIGFPLGCMQRAGREAMSEIPYRSTTIPDEVACKSYNAFPRGRDEGTARDSRSTWVTRTCLETS